MKYLQVVLLLLLGVSVAGAQTQPAPKKASSGISKHALPKIATAVVRAAAVAPKATAVGLKDTLGGILFSAEAVVDVVHAGTTALNTAAAAELKHNPFEYVDKGAAYVDTGLEKAYAYFFNLQI